MEYTIEVVVVPVTDMDRAKEFYAEKCGFKVDLDQQVAPGTRIIQITPPGSRCSIALTSGLPPAPGLGQMAAGALQGVQICVTDIAASRAELAARGVDISEVQHVGVSGGWEPGPGDTWNAFAFFKDPDGNGWVLQEAPGPLSTR
ncbi:MULTISPECIES: VOC family protein [Streptomyces]|uniref:VOC family protein n=1 Tax=Streptomyces TaxID=1883 RepID=UPI0006EBAC5C|nr:MULTISPECIES: VOC family protein [Streptomyces]